MDLVKAVILNGVRRGEFVLISMSSKLRDSLVSLKRAEFECESIAELDKPKSNKGPLPRKQKWKH